MNYFNTSLSQLDRFDREDLPQILESIKEGSEIVNKRMKEKVNEVAGKKKYLNVETPV